VSKKNKVKLPLPRVAVISGELALKLLASLEELAGHDTYESEYDGQMMIMCHSCGWLEKGTHLPECSYLSAGKLIAEAYDPLPDNAM
jgi:hypothetical protein